MHTTQSHSPDVSTADGGKARKPSLFANISEGIRMSRARSRVESLLSDAFTQGGGVDTIKDASEAFSALDGKRQEDVFSFLDKRLKRCSCSTFDSEMKVQSAIVISQFLSQISSELPKDERGNKQNSSFLRFMPSLARISEGDPFFKESSKEHADARVSCTKALWDIEYDETEFWEDRIKDPVTSPLAIKLLLEMPPTVNPQAHGWALLKAHLTDSAYDIARNPSPKRVDFLMSMLKSGEPEKAEAVFQALLKLDVDYIPRELATLGFEMQSDPTDSALKSCASRFWDSLQKKVRQKTKAAEDPSGNATESGGQALHPPIERKAQKPSDMEAEMGHYITVLNCADDRQFDSANELISRYRMGRSMLGPLMPAIAQEMLDIIAEPAGTEEGGRAAQQAKAFNVLGKMFDDRMTGRMIIRQLLDMPQEAQALTSWRFLRSNLASISAGVVDSDSSNKTKFLLRMLEDADDDVVRAALHSAVYLDQIPNRMFSKGYELIQAKRLADDAAVFMEVSLQKEELESPGVSRYKAALMILDLHLGGNPHLARMVGSISDGIFADGQSSYSGKEGPTLLLAHLNAAGIRPKGIDLFAPELLQSTIHSLLEMPDSDGFRYRAWHLLAANIDALAIPIAENPSQKRVEFIMSMVHANTPVSIDTALQISAYLDRIPEGLLALAQDILKHEEAQALWRPARALIEVERLNSGLASGGSRYDYATGLVSLFNEGNQHLGLKLRRIGSEMESISKGDDTVESERARAVQDEIRKTLTR